jgi:DMSO/TMAO reductase YedYZ molybdopterin-dependent catalytic subunit
MSDVGQQVRDLVTKADELLKAASNRRDPELGRTAARGRLDEAASMLRLVEDQATRDDLVVLIGRRLDDLGVAERSVELASAMTPGAARSIPLPQATAATVASGPREGDQRVPSGQHRVQGLPVLHVGRVPERTESDVNLRVTGLVEGRRHDLSMTQLRELPEVTLTTDIHCVTGWSRLDVSWTGVRVRDLLNELGVLPGATHALAYGANAYSANLDLATLLRDDVLLAWACDGEPLTPEHGGPLRLVCPSRYFWKSTKWLETIQLLDRDVPGYWEARGYHNVADPFLAQRYA